MAPAMRMQAAEARSLARRKGGISALAEFPELLAALTVGLSFSNVGICILMAAGCTAEDRSSAGYFILGRAAGLMILGAVIMLFGVIFDGFVLYFILAFGTLSVALGAIMFYEAYTGRRVQVLEGLRFSLHGKKRVTRCQSPEGPLPKKGKAACGGRGDGTGPRAGARRRFLALGIVRGATPCLKIMVLAPLLIVSPLHLAAAMLAVFVLSSSLYPVIGFLGMSVFDGAGKYERHIKVAGALAIMFIGLFVVVNHYYKFTGA